MNLTDKIRTFDKGVVRNPFQGEDKKVLFVCSAGILRSATAARLYAHKYNTRCAGTGLEFALIPLTDTLMEWADEIVFVNPFNYDQAGWHYDLRFHKEKIKILNIPDEHEHMAPELIQAFKDQYEDF